MNQAAAAAKMEAFPGPRMRSFLSFLGLAGGVYVEADRQRKARLAGVDLAEPKAPLEEVLSQVGLDIPNLEAILAKAMGDTPEARRAAAAVIRSRDAAKLLQDFASRCAGSPSEATTAPPAADSAPATGATPTPGPATATPSPDPQPQPTAAPTAAPPTAAPIFHPPHTHAARQAASPPVDAASADPLGSWFYSAVDPNLGYRPEFDPLGQGAPPGWRPVEARKPPPPPRVPPPTAKSSARPGWSLGKLPTRPRRATPPAATPRPAPQVRTPKAKDAATTSPSTSTTATKSTPEAQLLKDFIEWTKAKLEAIESRMDAEIAETRRQLEEAIQRLDRLERAFEAFAASRREAVAPIDTKSAAEIAAVDEDAAIDPEPAVLIDDAEPEMPVVVESAEPESEVVIVGDDLVEADLDPEAGEDAAPPPDPAESSLIQLAQAQTQALLDAHAEQRQRELRDMQGQLTAVNERIRQMEAACPT